MIPFHNGKFINNDGLPAYCLLNETIYAVTGVDIIERSAQRVSADSINIMIRIIFYFKIPIL